MDLRKWQKMNRWSNEAIAKDIGVSNATISRVGRKLGMPSLMLAKAIVRFTDGEVTFADLGIEEK